MMHSSTRQRVTMAMRQTRLVLVHRTLNSPINSPFIFLHFGTSPSICQEGPSFFSLPIKLLYVLQKPSHLFHKHSWSTGSSDLSTSFGNFYFQNFCDHYILNQNSLVVLSTYSDDLGLFLACHLPAV